MLDGLSRVLRVLVVGVLVFAPFFFYCLPTSAEEKSVKKETQEPPQHPTTVQEHYNKLMAFCLGPRLIVDKVNVDTKAANDPVVGTKAADNLATQFQAYATGCNTLLSALKTLAEVEQNKIKDARTIEKEDEEKEKENKKIQTRDNWGTYGLYCLFLINVFIIIVAIVMGWSAYGQTDFKQIFKSASGKWSFSRIVGFIGCCVGVILTVFVMDITLSHFFRFGSVPTDAGLMFGTVAGIFTTQLPYIVNRLTGSSS